MKVRIYKAPDGKGKFVNKLSTFMQKASRGVQVKDRATLYNEILTRSEIDTNNESIADSIAADYDLDYYDVLDEVEMVLGFPQDMPEERVNEVPNDVTNPGPEELYNYNLDNNGVEEADIMDDEENEAIADDEESEKKIGGSIGKRHFVKGVMRSLKKASEGMEQEGSNEADIMDIPIGGRQSFVNNWKQGVKNLGNEFYAKQMYDQINKTPTEDSSMNGLETAGKGKQVRQANRQVRHAQKDFKNAFGDMAAGYFGAPGMPNYLQMINVVDPNKASQGQLPQGTTMPGIDFQYKKGPWWTGKREWSAKGIPVGMMMGAPGMQSRGYNTGYNPGYNTGYNHWSTSSHGTRQLPGKVITETTTRLINANADPAKVNNVALNTNTNGTTTTNTEWQTSMPYGRTNAADNNVKFYNERVPSGNTDYEGTGVYEDDIWSSPIFQSDYNAIYDLANKIGHDKLTPEQADLLNQRSYITKDDQGNEYSTNGLRTRDTEAIYDKQIDDVVKQQYQYNLATGHEFVDDKEAYDKAMELAIKNKSKVGPRIPNTFVSFPPRQEFGGVTDSSFVNEDGGFVDPSQMQPGVLQKFFAGGDEISPMVQYQDDDLETKNVDDPYNFKRGGLLKAGPGTVVNFDPNAPVPGNVNPQYQSPAHQRFAPGTSVEQNKSAYNELIRRGVLDASSQYDPTKSYAGMTDSQTQTQNQTQNQGYNQGYGQQFTGYPTAPTVREQIGRILNPFHDKSGNFTWASQSGPAKTLDGQIYQPQTQNQNAVIAGQNVPVTPELMNNMGVSTQNPLSGYVQDYNYTKKPWYMGGKQTISLTNRYVGADGKPASATNPPVENPPVENKPGIGVYAPGQGVNANMKPAATTVPGATTNTTVPTNTNTNVNTNVNTNAIEEPEGNTDKYARRDERYNNRNDRRMERKGYSENSDVTPVSDADYMQKYKASLPVSNEEYMQKYNANNAANKTSEDQHEAEYMQKYNDSKAQTQKINEQVKNIPPSFGFEFGGSALHRFIGGGINSGTGQYDPNISTFDSNTDINEDECTEFEKKDPNSQCYDANASLPAFARPGASIQEMMGTNTNTEGTANTNPQDFVTNYDLHNAKSIDTNAVANLGKLAGRSIQGADNLNRNEYSKQYNLANIASSDSREPTNDLDYTGGVSGLTQRIGSKGQGKGSTQFNSVVGEAAYVKYGGTPNYKEGGVYEMSKDQILKFMAQGGKIEFTN
jgi:hypothetical protein